MSKINETEEFIELITSFQGRLYGYILSLVGNPNDVNDILQETNLVMWKNSAEFEIGTNFKAWSFRIANFQVMAFRQRQVRDKLVFDDSVLERIIEDTEKADEYYNERRIALHQCIEKLNDRQRDLITRRYKDGFSVQAIAADLMNSASTIAQALFRARQSLIRCVQSQPEVN